MTDDHDEYERALAESEDAVERLSASINSLNQTTARLEHNNATSTLGRGAAELAMSGARHEHRAANQRLEERTHTLARATSRMEHANEADALGWSVDNLNGRILSLQESAKVSEQARKRRAALSSDMPNSLNFRTMTYGEQMAAKAKAIQRDWQRAQEDGVVVGDYEYTGDLAIINMASYDELRDIEVFQYKATADADDFQANVLEMYHDGMMCDKDTPGAKSVTRYIKGGCLLHYISKHPKLSNMKERLTKAHEFWVNHSKYRTSFFRCPHSKFSRLTIAFFMFSLLVQPSHTGTP